MPSEELIADHVLEFPGGYTRTTGPVIGRFLTELRDGRIVGVRTAGGRTSSPLEYDPDTGEAVTGEFAEVGPAGTVESWAWVSEPRKGHPLERPFAWALIRLDGADTALVHAVDAGDARAMRPGLRVRPRWRAERTGHITDIESFVPEVTRIVSPVRAEYRVKPGKSLARFLEGRARDLPRLPVRLLRQGLRALPPVVPRVRRGDHRGGGAPGHRDHHHLRDQQPPRPPRPQVPFVSAYILLDGSDIPMIALVGDIPAHEVRQGMRVRAVWVPEEERTASMSNIRWFAPTGEPDAEL
nr:OB-fold nucleic acid binding domain-containing protein [Planobispora longispora]